MTLKKIHRVLGLCAATFWLIQAVTGVLLTFRQEIDNAIVSRPGSPVETAALGQRIGAIQQAGGRVSSLWVTDFAADRFDLRYVDSVGTERLMRVDGAGRVLRDGLENTRVANGGFFRTLTLIHTSLLAGETGEWIIALSGVLLISNVVLGLTLAWPRRGMWKQALTVRLVSPPAARPAASRSYAAARFYGIHRALGLWIAIPLLVVFVAGVALRFDDDIESALGVVLPPPSEAPVGSGVTPTRALDLVLARYPGATLTNLSMPTPATAWYRVRVHAPGEVPRMYGTTTLFVSAANGSVLREYPAASVSLARSFYD